MWTPEFEAFVAPARKTPQMWRVIVGIAMVAFLYVVGFVCLVVGLTLVSGRSGTERWLTSLGDSPTALLMVLATFLGMAAGTFAAARALHDRPAATLFGSGLWQGFALAVLAATGVFLLTVILLPTPFEFSRHTPDDVFLVFLIPALIGILIQTGAEEILFRGYLQQQFAARFHHPVVWMVIPSLMFGALHYDPAGAGGNWIWIILATTVFGLVAADLTRVTGSIGAAWGFHFVNNCIAMLVVALDGPLSGLSYWKLEASAADITPVIIAQDIAVTVIIWLVIRLWLARRIAQP